MENKYLEVLDENKMIHKTLIKIDSLSIIDAYATICFVEKHDNAYYNYSGVIDKNLNTVVPFRSVLIEDDEFNYANMPNYVPIYGSHIAVFIVDDAEDYEGYIIDLNTIKFSYDKNKECLKPDRYLRKINGYMTVSEEVILLYIDNYFYTYNPSLDQILSIKLDNAYYLNSGEEDQIIGSIEIEIPYDSSLKVSFYILPDGSLSNEIIIDNNLGRIEAMVSNDVLSNREKLIEECKNIYVSYNYVDDSIGDDLCKWLH